MTEPNSVPSGTPAPAQGQPAPAQGEPDVSVPTEILQLRSSIDNIDAAITHLLAERFKCTRRVGELKAAGGLPPADLVREHQQIERLKQIAERAGLDPVFAQEFRRFIVSEVIRHHQMIAAQHEGPEPVLDIYS